MRELIQFHISEDPQEQEALERSFAQDIESVHRRNLSVFKRVIPSLSEILASGPMERMSLFVNKEGQANIVDYTIGRCLYGHNPQQEVECHVSEFQQHSWYLSLGATEQVSSASGLWLPSTRPLPKTLDVLVVMGIGLGQAIETLTTEHDIKHVVIYEPNLDYFKCSCFVRDWQSILTLCNSKGTALYFQIGENGANIVNDIKELRAHFEFEDVYLYKHYHTPIFDSLCQHLLSQSWSSVDAQNFAINHQYDYMNFAPEWNSNATLTGVRAATKEDSLFDANISAFEHFFPEIAQEFADYEPETWFPARETSGKFTVVNSNAQSRLVDGDLTETAHQDFEFFCRYPNKNGLVLGYKGEKLKHYKHYEFVTKTEKLVDNVEDEVSTLPDTIQAFIFFGIGAGGALTSLLDQYVVEKLFICEPNRDLFYASLFHLDWHSLLNKIDEQEGHVYINVGDDGTNLTKDLIKQFYSHGPYLLSQTYIYQGYINQVIDEALGNLQQQLKLLLSMGDYFDHAFYGINHTREMIRRDIPIMLNYPAQRLSFDAKNTPVILVGNGPSLDSSLEALKELADQAIIVSCGTSLKTLYENDITPDFHCEIEQNRATFDWACRVGSFEFLKQISLLSCNGIHPDTCSLYKDAYIAFKEGEASTVTWTSVINIESLNILSFAFPTVSNFALDFFTGMGINELYLVGVDLGYTDLKRHHSSASGYYDDNGEELFDYASASQVVLQVSGNFQPTVYTKHEFRISKMVMEETLVGRSVDVYNCSNGAYINSTTPLAIENILITTTEQQKTAAVEEVKTKLFANSFNQQAYHRFEQLFSVEPLLEDLHKFHAVSLDELTDSNVEKIDSLVEQQRQILVDSVQQNTSLLFYYMYGSFNYASAVMSKLSHANDAVRDQCIPECLNEWQHCVDAIIQTVEENPLKLDQSSSMRWLRIKAFSNNHLNQKKVLLFTNSTSFATAFTSHCQHRNIELTIDAKPINLSPTGLEQAKQYDYVLYYLTECFEHQTELNLILEQGQVWRSQQGNALLMLDYPCNALKSRLPEGVSLVQMDGDINVENDRPYSHVLNDAFHAVNGLCQQNHGCFIIPKVITKGGAMHAGYIFDDSVSSELDWYETNLWLIGFDKGQTPSVWFDGFGNSLEPVKTTALKNKVVVSDMPQSDIENALSNAAAETPFILSDKEYV